MFQGCLKVDLELCANFFINLKLGGHSKLVCLIAKLFFGEWLSLSMENIFFDKPCIGKTNAESVQTQD